MLVIDGLRVGFLSGIGNTGSKRHGGQGSIYYTQDELATAMDAVSAEKCDLLISHNWPDGLAVDDQFDRPVGDPNVRALIEASRATLSLHGHMHTPHTATIGTTEVACLSIVGSHEGTGLEAVGLWEVEPGRSPAKRLI